MHRTFLLAWAGLLVLFAAASSLAREAMPTEWPLERIVANLEQLVKTTPDDAQAHYNLGRAHAFAFSLKRSTLLVYGETVAELERQNRPSRPLDASVSPRVLHEDALRVELAEGMRHLRRACALLADNARFHLTLAWLLEIGAPAGDELDTAAVFDLDPARMPAERIETARRCIADLRSSDAGTASAARGTLLAPENVDAAVVLLGPDSASSDPERSALVAELARRCWTEHSIAEYWLAFSHGVEADLSPDHGHWILSELVSYEAALAYERLVLARGAPSPLEEKNLEELAAKKTELETHSRTAFITPMLVSLAGCASLDHLVMPDLAVPFDLDGDCVDEVWPWLAPDAGWLVWDPNHRGEITSGRQLFGSASAWLFFEDGYRVLDALDDDRDGELRGPELAGIAVWFDRDSDGVSDRGEVVPVEALGIVALATTATEHIGASLGNPGGLELADGRILPTYDWVIERRSEP